MNKKAFILWLNVPKVTAYEHAILSEKDTKHDVLKDFDSPFDINIDLYK